VTHCTPDFFSGDQYIRKFALKNIDSFPHVGAGFNCSQPCRQAQEERHVRFQKHALLLTTYTPHCLYPRDKLFITKRKDGISMTESLPGPEHQLLSLWGLVDFS
jgi:hypothetical protein